MFLNKWAPVASFTMSKTNLLWYPMRLRSPARTLLFKALLGGSPPKPQDDSTTSIRVKDTLVRVFLPFKSNPGLFADYANIYGGLRVGKLLEDLDAMAASVAFLTMNNNSRLTMVTAAVDHIEIDTTQRLITNNQIADLRLSALATFSSHSSIEVSIFVEKLEEEENWEAVARANFIMVSRTLDGQRPAEPLPQLIADSVEEEGLLEQGLKRSLKRKAKRETSLEIVPPTAQENAQIHKLFLSSERQKVGKRVSETMMQTTRLCQPQERNIHDRIFGGYLMREAFELAFSTALVHQRTAMEVQAIDDIAFVAPVEIGSILQLQATIVFTNTECLHVQVVADVIKAEEEGKQTTNIFFFTFVPLNNTPVKLVVPETYQEGMDWLQAQRRVTQFSYSCD